MTPHAAFRRLEATDAGMRDLTGPVAWAERTILKWYDDAVILGPSGVTVEGPRDADGYTPIRVRFVWASAMYEARKADA